MPKGTAPPAQQLTREVCALLKAGMARRSLSALRVSEKVAISHSQLTAILRGQKPLSLDLFDRICYELEIDPVKILIEALEETSGRNQGLTPPLASERKQANAAGGDF